VLELCEVVKRYPSDAEVIDALAGVSLRVAAGEIVALYGPSGSGKTTLLLHAAGMERPDAGSVVFDGRDLVEMSGREATRYWRSELGVVWQKFHLLPTLSALDNAGLKLLAAGASRRTARRQAAPWLERVGLADRARHLASRLSTGEAQRVAIARALANGPKLLLADEPTGNLDTARSEEVLSMLADLSHRDGLAVLVATHDPEAAAFADRVLTLRDGKLRDGKPGDDREPSRFVAGTGVGDA
jgi:putative ABC transport system ATP-binding protein